MEFLKSYSGNLLIIPYQLFPTKSAVLTYYLNYVSSFDLSVVKDWWNLVKMEQIMPVIGNTIKQ